MNADFVFERVFFEACFVGAEKGAAGYGEQFDCEGEEYNLVEHDGFI
jgi:hypothetical protein